jgi:hypothetical protein
VEAPSTNVHNQETVQLEGITLFLQQQVPPRDKVELVRAQNHSIMEICRALALALMVIQEDYKQI